VFADGEQIGHNLARVVVVGQGVDDRNIGVFGKFFNRLLRKSPDHDAVTVACHHSGAILDWFATAHLGGFGMQKQSVTSELEHANFK